MTGIHTLHILNKAPDHPRATRCLEMISPDDGLLLIGGGVLFLSTGCLPDAAKVFALTADVDARGIGHLSGNTSMVDYTEMVALSLQAHRVISW
ncbi:sulfurtransferase complex subunit TusB [Marinobacter sp. F3R08]|uniref:sulfurtransferase complex subunit TusB n=1 Tax=Marinobacter sp. F3R08 TaxID=2841559 RepID=UPI001C08417A|nr:sulfurtransferase complex subunit TusB [Marinobacter sp. F3R08]MBU2955723.1 sulfurtransferase complex subunit TusB [Marinobacter sp. F3R08]